MTFCFVHKNTCITLSSRLCAFQILTHLILMTTLWGRNYFDPHFRAKELRYREAECFAQGHTAVDSGVPLSGSGKTLSAFNSYTASPL